MDKARVTLTDTGDALRVSFTGQAPRRAGSVFYSVIAFDETGEVGVQLGMQSEEGTEGLSAFVFDFVTVQQVDVGVPPQVAGDRVLGDFPKDQLGHLADTGVASWSAAFNVDGTDTGTCPAGADSLPFPD